MFRVNLSCRSSDGHFVERLLDAPLVDKQDSEVVVGLEKGVIQFQAQPVMILGFLLFPGMHERGGVEVLDIGVFRRDERGDCKVA